MEYSVSVPPDKQIIYDESPTSLMLGPVTNALITSLPFRITACQSEAIRDILMDLEQPQRSERLVQGDVGSGKTLVTAFAIFRAVEAGFQAALLAPTELLAHQHLNVLEDYISLIRRKMSSSSHDSDGKAESSTSLRPTVRLIKGALQNKERRSLLIELQRGDVDIIVGTHALLGTEVLSCFKRLGVAVIDEEQRFGVLQRQKLAKLTNTFYTTATPIPRSLSKVRYVTSKISCTCCYSTSLSLIADLVGIYEVNNFAFQASFQSASANNSAPSNSNAGPNFKIANPC